MELLGSPHLTDSSGTNAWGLLARGAHAGGWGGTVNTAGCVPSPATPSSTAACFPTQVTVRCPSPSTPSSKSRGQTFQNETYPLLSGRSGSKGAQGWGEIQPRSSPKRKRPESGYPWFLREARPKPRKADSGDHPLRHCSPFRWSPHPADQGCGGQEPPRRSTLMACRPASPRKESPVSVRD